MSIISRTSLVPEVLGSGAAVAPVPEVEADIFRGVFLPLVEGTEARTEEWLGSLPAGTKAMSFKNYINIADMTAEPAGGLYGDSCLKIPFTYRRFTTDYLTHNSQLNSTAHGFSENDKVYLQAEPGGTIPSGLNSSTSSTPLADGIAYIAILVTTDTLEVAKTFACSVSDSGGDVLITATNHGLSEDNKVRFRNNVASPIVTGTDYWVLADGLTASTLKISETQDGTPLAYSANSTGGYIHRSDKGVSFTSNGTGNHEITNTGPPSAFFIRSSSNGDGTVTSMAYNDQFTGPVSGRPYNTFEYLIKYPSGYRSAVLADGANYTRNIGTYHAPLNHYSEEIANYHFYVQYTERSDLADGNWIRARFRERPTYQRGTASPINPGTDPAPQTGASWTTSLARFYISNPPIYSYSSVVGEHAALFDRMRIYYEEPAHPITNTWDSLDNTVPLFLEYGVTSENAFTLTNTGGTAITGKLRHGFHPTISPAILDSEFNVVGSNDDVTVPAGGTWNGYLRLTSASTVGSAYDVSGVNFIPNDQFNPVTPLSGSGTEANLSDSNLQVDWWYNVNTNYGPSDGWAYAATVDLYRVMRCTFDPDTNLITAPNSTYANNARVRFYALSGSTFPSEITPSTHWGTGSAVYYYVRNPVGDTFGISTVSGGADIDFSAATGTDLFIRA